LLSAATFADTHLRLLCKPETALDRLPFEQWKDPLEDTQSVGLILPAQPQKYRPGGPLRRVGSDVGEVQLQGYQEPSLPDGPPRRGTDPVCLGGLVPWLWKSEGLMEKAIDINPSPVRMCTTTVQHLLKGWTPVVGHAFGCWGYSRTGYSFSSLMRACSVVNRQ